MSIEKGDLFASTDSRDKAAGGRIIRITDQTRLNRQNDVQHQAFVVEHWNEKMQGRHTWVSEATLREKYERVSR